MSPTGAAAEPLEPPFERRPATDAEARALASGLRIRILRMTIDESLTNQEIAARLGRNPASVLHHVRTLLDAGFLRAEPVRRGVRGAREIPYRSTGKSWYMDTGVLGSPLLEAFLTEIEAVPAEQRDLTRLGLRLPEAEMEELRERLHALVQEFHDRPRDPDAEPWSLFVAMHRDTTQRPATASGRDRPRR